MGGNSIVFCKFFHAPFKSKYSLRNLFVFFFMDIAAGGTLQLRYLYRHKKHKMHQGGIRVRTNIFSQNILTHTTFHKSVLSLTFFGKTKFLRKFKIKIFVPPVGLGHCYAIYCIVLAFFLFWHFSHIHIFLGMMQVVSYYRLRLPNM